ncbi:hypothetical protein B0T14DRAFT_607939 [Immersiella caudata]|uniref:Uncharacterized protein n=1 Tax=Immersiella caudata TaxID=314043 RepID=A0AA39U534_9PEZI|nr:hypothetical protein B0T14DRAFT_607939 [Immersiella caudata]
MLPPSEDPSAPPKPDWKADLKSGLIGATAILYFTITLISTGILLQYSRKKWPVFKKEMCLILTGPFVCLMLGCFWPLAALAVACDWLCGVDKSWCGVGCGGLRRRMGVGRGWRAVEGREGEEILMVDRETEGEVDVEGLRVEGDGYGKEV